jgi:poly(A) polymerase
LKVKLSNIDPKLFTLLNEISKAANECNIQAYLVGGFVRDFILDRPLKNDIDITVVGDAIEFANKVCLRFNTKLSAQYKKFGTCLLKIEIEELGEYKIEFISARKESYNADSRKPDVEFSNLENDLARRDFTINALALSINDINDEETEVIEMYEGLNDLKNKLLKTPLEPEITFNDDPLRIMRAFRFASQLNFSIEANTFSAISRMAFRLRLDDKSGIVSQERITDEFFKILSSNYPSKGLILMQKSGVMKLLFPEISNLEGIEQRLDFHHKDVFYHTMLVLENISKKTDDVWLRYVALMHDIAKPPTKKFVEGIGWTFHGHEDLGAKWQKNFFKKYKFPYDKLHYAEKLIRLHLRPISLAGEGVTDSAIRRLIFEAGDDINDLMKLCRADITSKDPKKMSEFTSNFDRVEKRMKEVEERDNLRNFKSPVDGIEIMEIFNLSPSKEVGIIKKMIEEAILEGIIPNEYEAALKFLKNYKQEIEK